MNQDSLIQHLFDRLRRKPKSEPTPQLETEAAAQEETIIDIFELTWKGKALADFKAWLDDLPEDRTDGDSQRTGDSDGLPVLGCDLYTLLSEFVALRQDIKLQNREQHAAMRAHESLVENIKDSINLFQKASRDIDTLEERIRVTAEIHSVEHFFDVRDALSRGLDAGKTALSGIFFFRRSSREHINGVVEGYEMALRRFDRILNRFHITPLATMGKPFDPAFMRAVGKKTDPTKPAGIVIEEQLGGYMQGDVVLRFAEVIVNG